MEGRLRASGFLPAGTTARVVRGLDASHRALGTFATFRGAGYQGRTYDLADLQNAAVLADYSGPGSVPLDEIRGALSLLVCLTAESARSMMVGRAFERIFRLERVQADDAMQSYDQAVRLTRYAEAMRDLVLAHRIERIAKRADEMEGLFADAAVAGLDRRALIARALALPAPNATATREEQRLRDIIRELRVTTIEQVTEIVSICRNKTAIRAAMGGVLVPPL